jgi:hypothetical protein
MSSTVAGTSRANATDDERSNRMSSVSSRVRPAADDWPRLARLSSSPQPLFSAFPGDFLIEKTAGMSNRFASHYGTPEAQSNLSDRLDAVSLQTKGGFSARSRLQGTAKPHRRGTS